MPRAVAASVTRAKVGWVSSRVRLLPGLSGCSWTDRRRLSATAPRPMRFWPLRRTLTRGPHAGVLRATIGGALNCRPLRQAWDRSSAIVDRRPRLLGTRSLGWSTRISVAPTRGQHVFGWRVLGGLHGQRPLLLRLYSLRGSGAVVVRRRKGACPTIDNVLFQYFPKAMWRNEIYILPGILQLV